MISSIHDVKLGDKIAIEDININNEHFYVEAEILEGVTPKGFLITSQGTFDLNSTASFRRPVLIDDRIKVEIEKLKIKKYIHNFFQSKINKFTIDELRTIKNIIEAHYDTQN